MSLVEQKPEIISISASKIKVAFEDCFGKYYFQHVLKEKVNQVIWPGTSLGEIIHKYIENSINAIKQDIPLQEFKKTIIFESIFEDFLKQYKKDNKTFKYSRDTNKKQFLLKGQKYSELFVKFIYGYIELEKADTKLFIPEHKIEMFDEAGKKSGIIDLLKITIQEIYKIIDFKTTKDWNKWFYIDWMQDIQSMMYLYLIFEKYQAYVQEYDYMILDHDKRALFFKSKTYTQQEVIDSITTIKKLITLLITLHKDPEHQMVKKLYRPEKTKCYFCDFKDKCKRKVI